MTTKPVMSHQEPHLERQLTNKVSTVRTVAAGRDAECIALRNAIMWVVLDGWQERRMFLREDFVHVELNG